MAKIPWSRIREAFDGEWIELVECSWNGRASHPSAGHVRHHSPSRVELLKMIARSGRKDGAVVLFVGPALPCVLMHNEGSSIATSM
jgi:hypothetical protein